MAALPLLLEVQTGKHRGRRVRLTGAEILVGRGEEAAIRIASTEVSREHCRLIPLQGKVRVIDLNSRNGTFVDGRPVNGERILSRGGSLTVGPLTFLLVGNEETVVQCQVAVALKGRTGTSDQLSEDKIVDWLSDYELPVSRQNAAIETSVLKQDEILPAGLLNLNAANSNSTKSSAGHPQTANGKAPSNGNPLPGARPPRKPAVSPHGAPVRTVREEARDIIRRHMEKMAQEQQNPSSSRGQS